MEKNCPQYQSYISAIARASLSLYEQKILLKIVESAQNRIKGVRLSENQRLLEHNYNMAEVVLAIKDINDNDHYELVKDAVRRLSKREFECLDSAGSWHFANWIASATVRPRTGTLRLIVAKSFYDSIFNFAKGFVKYDLQRALRYKHPQTIRLYMLINGQTKPLTYGIENLKKMFGVSDKYKRTYDFVRKIIDVAQKEMQESGGNYFVYDYVKEGAKIVALKITPRKRIEIQAQKWTPSDIERILITEYQFTGKQLKANDGVISSFAQLENAVPICYEIIQRARKRNAGKGYIINALKAEI